MKSLVIAFLVCLSLPLGICHAEEKESETEQEPIHLERLIWGEPPTRSLQPVVPEAYVCGSEVNVTFDEPVSYVNVSICKAISDEPVYETAYTYAADVCIDLSAWGKGNYVIYLETETAVYKGSFSL